MSIYQHLAKGGNVARFITPPEEPINKLDFAPLVAAKKSQAQFPKEKAPKFDVLTKDANMTPIHRGMLAAKEASIATRLSNLGSKYHGMYSYMAQSQEYQDLIAEYAGLAEEVQAAVDHKANLLEVQGRIKEKSSFSDVSLDENDRPIILDTDDGGIDFVSVQKNYNTQYKDPAIIQESTYIDTGEGNMGDVWNHLKNMYSSAGLDEFSSPVDVGKVFNVPAHEIFGGDHTMHEMYNLFRQGSKSTKRNIYQLESAYNSFITGMQDPLVRRGLARGYFNDVRDGKSIYERDDDDKIVTRKLRDIRDPNLTDEERAQIIAEDRNDWVISKALEARRVFEVDDTDYDLSQQARAVSDSTSGARTKQEDTEWWWNLMHGTARTSEQLMDIEYMEYDYDVYGNATNTKRVVKKVPSGIGPQDRLKRAVPPGSAAVNFFGSFEFHGLNIPLRGSGSENSVHVMNLGRHRMMPVLQDDDKGYRLPRNEAEYEMAERMGDVLPVFDVGLLIDRGWAYDNLRGLYAKEAVGSLHTVKNDTISGTLHEFGREVFEEVNPVDRFGAALGDRFWAPDSKEVHKKAAGYGDIVKIADNQKQKDQVWKHYTGQDNAPGGYEDSYYVIGQVIMDPGFTLAHDPTGQYKDYATQSRENFKLSVHDMWNNRLKAGKTEIPISALDTVPGIR